MANILLIILLIFYGPLVRVVNIVFTQSPVNLCNNIMSCIYPLTRTQGLNTLAAYKCVP